MANMSNYLDNQCRDFFFRTQASIVKPSTLAVALTHNIPNGSYTGQTTDEVANAGAYARQVLAPSDSNWSTTSISGQTFNNVALAYAQATADWGPVSGVLILDSASYGAGNVIAWGALTNPRVVLNTDQYTISASGLNVQWS